jgi:hypothetical protein
MRARHHKSRATARNQERPPGIFKPLKFRQPTSAPNFLRAFDGDGF